MRKRERGKKRPEREREGEKNLLRKRETGSACEREIEIGVCRATAAKRTKPIHREGERGLQLINFGRIFSMRKQLSCLLGKQIVDKTFLESQSLFGTKTVQYTQELISSFLLDYFKKETFFKLHAKTKPSRHIYENNF